MRAALPDGFLYRPDVLTTAEEAALVAGIRAFDFAAVEMRGRVARWHWQHSIPPTRALRYSITFRTLRDPAGSRVRARLPSPA